MDISKNTSNIYKRGFTLIELLIVIAILGVLAAGIIIAIDPAEKIKQTKDAGRITTINQLAKAISGYYVSQGSYPAVNNIWQTTLVGAGEIHNIIVVSKTASYFCDGSFNGQSTNNNIQGYICYGLQNGVDPAIWTAVDSAHEQIRACGGSDSNTYAVYAWMASYGRAGIICLDFGTQEPWNSSHQFK